MKYEHMSLDELQRCDTDNLEAMAEIGRRFIDTTDPDDAEATLEDNKEFRSQCAKTLDDLRDRLRYAKEDFSDVLTDVGDQLESMQSEMED